MLPILSGGTEQVQLLLAAIVAWQQTRTAGQPYEVDTRTTEGGDSGPSLFGAPSLQAEQSWVPPPGLLHGRGAFPAPLTNRPTLRQHRRNIGDQRMKSCLRRWTSSSDKKLKTSVRLHKQKKKESRRRRLHVMRPSSWQYAPLKAGALALYWGAV